MATISTSGTWTTIRTPTTGNTPLTNANNPTLLNINPLDLTGGTPQGMAVLPDEVDQFVKLAVAQWGLSYWSTVILLNTMLTAIQMRGAPAQYAAA